MKPYTRLLLLTVVITAAVCAARAAKPEAVQHSEHCIGTITSFSPTAIEFTGNGVATHFGKYTIAGGHQYDEKGNISNGKFISTAADGSTISGMYKGTVTVLPDGLGRSDLQVVWQSGTGRFSRMTGEGNVVCIHGMGTGGRLEYVTSGNLTNR